MRQRPRLVTRAEVVAVVVVALLVVGTLLLNLRVDHLWARFPEQPGPCLTHQQVACRHNFVN